MPNYKRSFAPGHSIFITLITFQRKYFLVDAIAQRRAALRHVQTRHPFRLPASVVLPDHCHFLMELPEGDGDFSTRIGLFKAMFSRSLPKKETISSASRIRRREREIWQRRFWEHTRRDESDFQRHFDYIHFNPVKHGHVSRCIDWPYSSFRRYVEEGVYPADCESIEPAEIMDLKTGE